MRWDRTMTIGSDIEVGTVSSVSSRVIENSCGIEAECTP